MKKCSIYALVICGLLVITFASVTSALEVPMEANLWGEYVKNPNANPNIPNNSFAGYAYGEKPLPELPVVVNAKDYGAVGDGKTDNSVAINAALKAAFEKGGGAVLLPAGTYNISRVIFMAYDGVVLRGEGTDKTIIYATQSLEAMYGPNKLGTSSSWSWSGGMVWFAPKERRSEMASINTTQKGEGWINNKLITEITKVAKRGDMTVTVADGSTLKPGNRVLFTLTNSADNSLFKNIAGDVTGADTYDWAVDARGMVKDKNSGWNWPVEITAVKDNVITLKQPLRTDISLAWKPRFLTLGPVVRDAGVEHLAIRMTQARLSEHLMNPGWNGVSFESAWDCWARDIVVYDVDNGLGTVSSKCITLDGFRVEGRRVHHATYTRVFSHDILFTRFRINAQIHHGINVEGLSSGCVWSAADMAHGTFDSHRGEPFDCIRTDITVFNDGGHGGGSAAGPLFGARFAHWNIRVTNNDPSMIHIDNMAPRSAVVGIQGAGKVTKPEVDFDGDLQSVVEADGKEVLPQDLHAAQLALRLGRIPYYMGRAIEVVLHRTDGSGILVTWHEPFTTERTYEIARSEDGKNWVEKYATTVGPVTQFLDKNIVPGSLYSYRVRAIRADGASDWSAEVMQVNRPARVTDIAWSEVKENGSAMKLAWTPGEESGNIVIDRRDGVDEALPWQKALVILPISDKTYTDTTAKPGTRYTYRFSLINPSGISDPVEVNSYMAAAGLTEMRETFDTIIRTDLPAASIGENTFGTWQWIGINGDNRPYLNANNNSTLGPQTVNGTLEWPSTRGGALSFVSSETFHANLSVVGARVHYEVYNGQSVVNTHRVGVCLRLGDGTWIIDGQPYTLPPKGWINRDELLADTTWYTFDPIKLGIGETVKKPEMSNVTGFGLRIERPINNRIIWLDNISVWGVPIK